MVWRRETSIDETHPTGTDRCRWRDWCSGGITSIILGKWRTHFVSNRVSRFLVEINDRDGSIASNLNHHHSDYQQESPRHLTSRHSHWSPGWWFERRKDPRHDLSLTLEAFFSSSVCRSLRPSRSCSRCCCKRALALMKRTNQQRSIDHTRAKEFETNLFGNGIEGILFGKRRVVLILSSTCRCHGSCFSNSTHCRRTHHIANERDLWSKEKFMTAEMWRESSQTDNQRA